MTDRAPVLKGSLPVIHSLLLLVKSAASRPFQLKDAEVFG